MVTTYKQTNFAYFVRVDALPVTSQAMIECGPLESGPVNNVLRRCTLCFICWTFYNFDTWTTDIYDVV